MADQTPVVAQASPYAVDLTAGKAVFWCACGRSANQPYCDGSHKDTGMEPVRFVPDADKTYYLCGCKQTGTAPLCDGSHSKIT